MRTQPINLTRINRDRPKMRQPNWSAMTAIVAAAALATGFVAGTAVLDAAPIAIRGAASSSMPTAKTNYMKSPLQRETAQQKAIACAFSFLLIRLAASSNQGPTTSTADPGEAAHRARQKESP